MKEKIDPWGKMDVKDYGKLSREFGIEKFEPFSKKLPEPYLAMRRGVVFGHRDFGRILECIVHKKPYAMMTGLMPSGKFHVGHRMLAEQIIYYQNHGAHVYLCVADIEAYNMRVGSIKELRKTAIEEYLLNYIALGLKPNNCDFYFQSDRTRNAKESNAYYRLIGMVSKRVTHSEMEAIYGELSPGKIMSVLTQVGDILHPELDEFGGPKPVLVPVGVDQDPHIRLTRDLADRFTKAGEFRFVPPSSTYHEFMKGLKGGKMSSSDPTSYIALTDTPEQAKEKIMKYAFSGGRGSIKEHREKGGVPEVDVSYNMLYFMFEPDDKKIEQIRDDYKSGKMLTGELKQILIEKLQKFLAEHAEKREKAKDKVNEFLDLTTG
jgi:tryptophanyl-tRNA synthetase